MLARGLGVAHVIHASLGVPGEAHLVDHVLEGALGDAALRDQAPVEEGVGEAGGAQEVGEAVGLVGPFRIGERVVTAAASASPQVDLAVLGPGGAALIGAEEVATVAA